MVHGKERCSAVKKQQQPQTCAFTAYAETKEPDTKACLLCDSICNKFKNRPTVTHTSRDRGRERHWGACPRIRPTEYARPMHLHT